MRTTSQTKISSIIKLFVLFLLGTMLVVSASVALRRLCAMKTVHAFTPAESYRQVTTNTTLYKNNDLTGEIFTIPEGYFVKILSTTDSLSRVEYNSIIGYINNTETITVSTTPATIYQTATLYTRSDAGTHLRTEPNTSSSVATLIPAGSTLEYIGEINGTTPSDGTCSIWYYVHYMSGATTVHTGYVYSERTIITNLSATPAIGNERIETTPTNSSPTSTADEDLTETATTPLSSGLKIFLVILFATLGIIIFALLLISPKGDRKKTKKEKTSFSPTPPSNLDTPDKKNIPAYNQPEFGNFVEFTQPTDKNTPNTTFKIPSRTSSHKKNIRIKNITTPNNPDQTLPPSIAKYFKTERRPDSFYDDELL